MKGKLQKLATQLQGELYDDTTMRSLYATDASAYREMPLAVAIPKTKDDIQLLIQFAKENKTNLIPRTAGTSLAGQVVGNGIIVDVSKHFTKNIGSLVFVIIKKTKNQEMLKQGFVTKAIIIRTKLNFDRLSGNCIFFCSNDVILVNKKHAFIM
jgi:ribosomal protein L14